MFWYLATPYSKYPRGTKAAFREASRQAGLLITAGFPVFCPIAHSHPIAKHGGIDPLDHTVWLPADEPFMQAAFGLIVCLMDGWRKSVGIAHEIEYFRTRGKPIVHMAPGCVPREQLRYAAKGKVLA